MTTPQEAFRLEAGTAKWFQAQITTPEVESTLHRAFAAYAWSACDLPDGASRIRGARDFITTVGNFGVKTPPPQRREFPNLLDTRDFAGPIPVSPNKQPEILS
jgi:hypothetical protein